jgi:hypothetical protein
MRTLLKGKAPRKQPLLPASSHTLICHQAHYIRGRILAENIDKRASAGFVIFLDHSTEKHEVKTMELVEKQVTTPTQSWINRAERAHPTSVDYHSELRSWVQRAILEAERNKDFNKKDQLLGLLDDL